jgi:hypothetical protein
MKFGCPPSRRHLLWTIPYVMYTDRWILYRIVLGQTENPEPFNISIPTADVKLSVSKGIQGTFSCYVQKR